MNLKYGNSFFDKLDENEATENLHRGEQIVNKEEVNEQGSEFVKFAFNEEQADTIKEYSERTTDLHNKVYTGLSQEKQKLLTNIYENGLPYYFQPGYEQRDLSTFA